MTQKEIDQSIKSMKIHLTQGEKFEHWLNFILLLIPLGSFGFVFIQKANSMGENIITLGLILIPFLLILRHKLICTKFDIYKTELTEEQFKQANQAAAILNEWEVLSNTKHYFSAIYYPNWQWDGIKISAILKNNRIYLNSMVNPSIRSNPFNFGLNKKHKIELISKYQLIIKGQDVVEDANKELEKRDHEFWKESEWNLKNVLKRLVAYGLSFLYVGSIFMLISTGEPEAIVLSLPIIIIIFIYIYNDIQIILAKRKKKEKEEKNINKSLNLKK